MICISSLKRYTFGTSQDIAHIDIILRFAKTSRVDGYIIILYKSVQLSLGALSYGPSATGEFLCASLQIHIYTHSQNTSEPAPLAADRKHIDKTSNSQYWLLQQVKFHASAAP